MYAVVLMASRLFRRKPFVLKLDGEWERMRHILDTMNDDTISPSNGSDEDNGILINILRRNKKPKPTPSLKFCALKSIADNIWYWMSHVPPNANDELYIISPFNVLRASDIMSIIKMLADKKMFRHEHFHLFLHYNLTTMDFSILSKQVNVTDSVMKCMFHRCDRVKDLTIPNARLSLNILNNIPVQYPNLEYLHIHREVCQYRFLDLVASHCSKLKLLMIKNCVNIHDAMFDRIKNCSALSSLSLHHAENMTSATFQRIIEQLPGLCHLSLIGCKMNFASLNENNVEYQHLRSLDLSWSNVTDYGLRQITSRMRNLSELQLRRCPNLTTAAFKYISNLHLLHKLSIGYFTRDYKFDSHVEFCLLQVGMNLRYLDLSGMPLIQPQTIAVCCPHLRVLHMNHCINPNIDWIPVTNENSASSQNVHGSRLSSFLDLCQGVEELSISCMHLRGDDIGKIFSSSLSLKKLKFLPWSYSSLVPISESFFIDLLNNFYFENLEELDISRNNGVTKRVILRVLELYPNLRRLCVSSCNLGTHELATIKDIVTYAQLDMVIEVTYWKNLVRLL